MPQSVTTHCVSWRLAKIVATAVVGASIASACSSGSGHPADSVTQKPALTIGLNDTPISLDPAKDGTTTYMIVRPLTNASLIHMRPDGTFTPDLATSWRYVGSGNTRFQLTLRHDARFSDGEAVTAQAVKGWLDYFVNANGPNLSFVGPIRRVSATGRWTVRIDQQSPNPTMAFALSDENNWGAISSPKALAHPSVLGTTTAGAGPYMLSAGETVTGDHYTYVPNKYYYDPAAIRYSKITAKVIRTPSSMLQSISAGQVDVAIGDPSTADAATKTAQVLHAPNVTSMLTLDPSGAVSKPLTDVRVRQALNYAVDRKAITTAMVGKYGAPSAEFASSDGIDPAYRDYYPYNPKRARALLAAAGYSTGFTLGVLVNGSGGGNLGIPLGQAVAKYLHAVGVTLRFTSPTTSSAWAQKLLSNTTLPMLEAGTAASRSMWVQYGAFLKRKSVYNRLGSWSDPTVDTLWADGSRSSDPGPYWQRISRRITAQAYFIPLLQSDAIYYVSNKVRGVSIVAARQYPLATEWSSR